jgi:anti-anti-sigma factor
MFALMNLTMGNCRIDYKATNENCSLDVLGELDFSNSVLLTTAISRAAIRYSGIVTVNFVNCRYTDCSCLTVLIKAFKEHSFRLRIVAPRGTSLRKICDLTELTPLLPIMAGKLLSNENPTHLSDSDILCGRNQQTNAVVRLIAY